MAKTLCTFVQLFLTALVRGTRIVLFRRRSSVKHGRFLPFPFVQQYDSSLQNDSFVLAIL